MQLYTNSVDTDTVREETRNDRDYLVAQVTVARPLELNGGYVADNTWAQSVPEWNNSPLPIGHPVDVHGNYITANLPEVLDNAVVGNLYYTEYDFDARELNAELWADIERTEGLGTYGERIVEILENGEELEVSSAYRGDEGQPGIYEGVDGEEYREEVKVNLRPDHVALLPDELGPGKCGCSDGCGVDASEGTAENVATPSDAAFANTIGVSGHSPTSAGPDAVPGAGYCVNGPDGQQADRVVVNMRPDDADDIDGDAGSAGSSAANATTGDSNEMIPNQSEGDRVRWTGTDDDTRYGIVADELDDEDDDADGSVLIAVYEQEDTDADDDSVEWVRSDETVTVAEDSLDVIDQFPAQPLSSDDTDTDANSATGGLHANILAEARTPTYESTMTTEETEAEDIHSWELWWGLDEYLDAWVDETGAEYQGDPYSALSEVPEDARGWIAEHTLLGNPDAETEDNLTLGAVVGPDGTLYEEILEDVLGTEGARWTIPAEQRESARTVAQQLLVDEFDHDADGMAANTPENPPGWFRSFCQSIGINWGGTDAASTSTTCDCDANSHEPCTCDHDHNHDGHDDHDDGADGGFEFDINDDQRNIMTDLTDDDYEQIANSTGFDVGQLRKMDDDKLDNFHSLVNAAEAADDANEGDDPSGNDGEGDDPDGGDDTGGDDPDDDVDANEEIPEPVQNEIDSLRETVEAQSETIESLNEEREAEEQADRDEAKETINNHSNQYTDEQLDAMDTPVLKTTANALAANNSGTDWGGLNTQHDADMNTNSDEDEGSATGGAFADYKANEEEAAD